MIFAFFWFLWAGKDLIDYNDIHSIQSLSFNQNFSEVSNITIHGGLADTITLTVAEQTQVTANITGHPEAIFAVRESRNFIIGSDKNNIDFTSCPWFKKCPAISRLVSIEVIIPFDFSGNIFVYGVAPSIFVSSPRLTDNIQYLAINTADSSIEITNISSDIFINTAKLDLTLTNTSNNLSVNSTSTNVNYYPGESVSSDLNISSGFAEISIHQMPVKGVIIESTGINTTMIENQIETRYFASQTFEYDYLESEHKIDISINALYAIIHVDKKITP